MSNVAALSKPVEIESINNTFTCPPVISAVVSRFFSPPLMPRSKALPTMVRWHRERPRTRSVCSTLPVFLVVLPAERAAVEEEEEGEEEEGEEEEEEKEADA